MKKILFFISCILAFVPVPSASRAADTLCCIGDYHNRGTDQGFYWFYVDLKMNGKVVERLSWETSYASDLVPSGRACRIDATRFQQARLKDNTIILRDPASSCTVSLTPKKKERGALVLDSDGCLEQFCKESGVLIPIAVSMASKKCTARPKR
jgi:hypothetical protein